MDRPQVLSVDDMMTNHELIKSYLAEHYEVHTATSGHDAIRQAEELKPDIILMDVNMPDIDGYEACKQIKQSPSNQSTPIIFISSLNSIEDRMRGYESGGEEYIGKPVYKEELITKIKKLLDYRIQFKQLKSGLDTASNTAFSVMTNLSEMGVIIEFIENSFSCTTMNNLVEAIFQATSNYGLSCCLQLRVGQDPSNYSSQGILAPLELEIMNRSKNANSTVNAGSRSLFNTLGITLLIKNMPVEDEEKYGRFKDHLAILVRGAQAKLNQLMDAEKYEKSKGMKIDMALESIKHDLEYLDNNFKEFEKLIKTTTQDLFTDAEYSIAGMSLTAEQEHDFMEILDNSRLKLEASFDAGVLIDTCFENISNKLNTILL